MNEKWGSMKHAANEHSMDCLNKECKYSSGVIRVAIK